MKTLGERIRELREARDLSLRELAKKIGDLSAAFLSDIELGRRHPSEKVLALMARELGTTVADLRGYDTRAPVAELRRLAASDPQFGLALRRAVEKGFSGKELLQVIEGKRTKEKEKEKKKK